MSQMTIQADPRPGKSSRHQLNQLRRQGLVPGVVYGHHQSAQPIQADSRGLQEILRRCSPSTVLQLTVTGAGALNVMVKEVQFDALSRQPRHIDLQAIDMSEPVQVAIPIRLEGDPVGLREGGILQIDLREVEVKALPGDLPEAIAVDISGLDFGRHLAVSDLLIPAGVELLTDPEQVVAGIISGKLEETPAPEVVAGGVAQATGEPEPPRQPETN